MINNLHISTENQLLTDVLFNFRMPIMVNEGSMEFI